MKVKLSYKTALVQAGKDMLEKGLTAETWGNISLRDPEEQLVYLTPSGMPYNTIVEDDVVVCTLDGTIVEGTRKPTIEKDMHLGVYRERPELNAMIHTHPVYSMVFSVLQKPIPAIMDEAAQAFGGTVECAPYALPGSPELATNCVQAVGQKGMACLLANHGAVCLGKDLKEAFKTCKVLEITAHVYQMVLAIGQPVPISQENIDFMYDFVQNHYGQGK